jgi:hypothetical protein
MHCPLFTQKKYTLSKLTLADSNKLNKKWPNI